MSDQLTWRRMPPVFRSLGRWVTVVQLVGYTTALVYVWWTTRMLPPGIADHYRGSEAPDGPMQFPKSLGEMLTITHTHLLSMAVIFVLGGISLGLCEGAPARWKRFLVAEPFGALLTSFGAMWLMRYVDPRFSWLLAASSGLMALAFYAQAFLVLRELGFRERGA